MLFLLYSSNPGPVENRVREAVDRIECRTDLLTVRSIAELRKLLGNPEISPKVVILIAKDRRELAELVNAKMLLEPLPVVTVVPDLEDRTVLLGHRLQPRLLISAAEDFEILEAVAGNLCRRAARAELGGLSSDNDVIGSTPW